MKKKVILSTLILTFAFESFSFSVESQGEMRLESRFFKNDHISSTEDVGYGIFSRLEATAKSKDKSLKVKTSLVGRVGRKDPERDVFYFEDAYLEKDFGLIQIFGGLRVVNWSAAEAFHPSDIINSRNFDTSFENAGKIGEPMIGFASQIGEVGLQAFYMPALRGPKYPSAQNRLSFMPQGFQVEKEAFVDKSGKTQGSWASQWALKTSYSNWGGDWSLYWVHHFDRSQPTIRPASVNTLKPIFVEMDQLGLNLQQQVSDFLVKIEIAQRIFKEDLISQDFGALPYRTHSILAGGVEYTFGWESGQETTFLSEVQFVEGVGKLQRRAANIFQRDGLLGLRHAFNDVSSKEIFLALIADLEISKQLMLTVSYSQRLKNNWKFVLGGRYVDAPTNASVVTDLRAFNQDHQVYFNLSRFF